MTLTASWLTPRWPAPAGVHALSTLRSGGCSTGAYQGLNLGDHVADDPAAVAANRRTLLRLARLPAEPLWLRQVHGVRAIDAGEWRPGIEADACHTHVAGRVCAVLTADCLPILLCSRDGGSVAAIHAGWRGLLHGVIEETVARMGVPPDRLIAWIGPGIGPEAFEVGEDVRDAFAGCADDVDDFFAPSARGRWLADLAGLARGRLRACGVRRVDGGSWCTASEAERFYSYRREGVTGRMATLIWREDPRRRTDVGPDLG
ncbi:MAG: peptidoglycan editing factor PgeF [Gammaproteobacteria bacterium]|nr:peptidoglycan editing factor PgeF [Gammaproteobacteria bacterium]